MIPYNKYTTKLSIQRDRNKNEPLYFLVIPPHFLQRIHPIKKIEITLGLENFLILISWVLYFGWTLEGSKIVILTSEKEITVRMWKINRKWRIFVFPK